MTYELAIGDRLFSSWSLRGWLLFRKFGIDTSIRYTKLYDPDLDAMRAEFAPTRTVPALRMDDAVIWDSFAIAETLAERHPDAGLWPSDATARAVARAISAEMHSSYTALRSNCPMDVRRIYTNFEPNDAVAADVERIETLWDHARQFASDGPWLFGAFSIADAMFAPVAMRFTTYGLARSDLSKAYIAQHINDPTFRQWRAMGFAENRQLDVYDKPLNIADWPGPKSLKAKPVDGIESINDKCPYSGKEITHVLELDGQRWGFCNAFCRDKTVADPEAWPAFVDMINQK